MNAKPAAEYDLRLRFATSADDPAGLRRLRAFLKAALRSYGIRCVRIQPASVTPSTTPLESPVIPPPHLPITLEHPDETKTEVCLS